jgi:hypothetical protein
VRKGARKKKQDSFSSKEMKMFSNLLKGDAPSRGMIIHWRKAKNARKAKNTFEK